MQELAQELAQEEAQPAQPLGHSHAPAAMLQRKPMAWGNIRIARLVAAWVLALVVSIITAAVVYVVALHAGLTNSREEAGHRLDVIDAGIEGEVARFEYLPSLLDSSPSVFRLLESPNTPLLQDEVNRYLHIVNDTAGSTTLYVLNRNGDCLAASDWNQPGTPFGANLAFRPYMRAALASGRGRFYGVGITSGLAGYYLSYALYQKGQLRGVATVKVDLGKTEQAWRKLPGNVLLLDERGVVILSSQAAWRYRPTAPLTAAALQDIATARPYGNQRLLPLNWKVTEKFADDAEIVTLAGVEYVSTSRYLNNFGWDLRVMENTAPVRAAARNTALLALLAMTVLWLLAVTQWQRQRALRHKMANQQALQRAYDSLESKVTTRTAELSAANAQLVEEIETRKTIEADLVKMHNERVHAGKMVALGQMSAGVVHELNQPLAALRTLSDNACVLLDHGRLDEVRGNLQRIGLLVDRLGLVTYQLKAFAHKSDQPRVAVSVRDTIANAHFLVAQRLREHAIEIHIDVAPDALAAMAEAARLEQVLVNLLGNAIDAMMAAPTRHLFISARSVQDQCMRLTVADTGPGIRADIFPRLFEPFNTSKPAGSGLGLGLMLSAHIVAEFGGRLRARNQHDGGACFMIELPLATSATSADPATPQD